MLVNKVESIAFKKNGINIINHITFGSRFLIFYRNFYSGNLYKTSNYISFNKKYVNIFRSSATIKDSYLKKIVSKIKNDVNQDKSLSNEILFIMNTGKNKLELLNKCIQRGNSKLIFLSSIKKTDNFNKIRNLNSILNFSKYLIEYLNLFTQNYICKFLQIINYFLDDETNKKIIEKKLQDWKKNMVNSDIMNSSFKNNDAEFKMQSKSETEKSTIINCDYNREKDTENLLTLYNKSLWDRFHTKLRDTAFLKNFFENPTIGKIFGESGISKAVKKMKILDPDFKLSEFIGMVETVIIPHYINAYVSGDEQALRLHSINTFFEILNSNVREFRSLGLKLSPEILFLGNVELKGAKISEIISYDFLSEEVEKTQLQPVFIFSFSTQQINCLTNSDGKVISGSKDDIIEVVYSIAITPHPNRNVVQLEYPYIITELAMVESSPIW